eukprot:2234998-Amphidinium_carterae.1
MDDEVISDECGPASGGLVPPGAELHTCTSGGRVLPDAESEKDTVGCGPALGGRVPPNDGDDHNSETNQDCDEDGEDSASDSNKSDGIDSRVGGETCELDEGSPEQGESDSLRDIQCHSCNLFGTCDSTQPCGNPSCLHRICNQCSIESDYCRECDDYEEEESSDEENEVERVGEQLDSDRTELLEQDMLDDRDLPAHVAFMWRDWFDRNVWKAGELLPSNQALFEQLAEALVCELDQAKLPKAPQRTNIRMTDANSCLEQGPPRFMLLGAYTTRGAGITAATSTPRGRRLLQLVHQLASAGGRSQEEYTSVSISEHHGLAPHVDRNNHPECQSWHVGLGSYRGGLLHLSKDAAGPEGRPGLHQVRNRWTAFD